MHLQENTLFDPRGKVILNVNTLLDPRGKVILNVKYLLHQITYAPAKFEVATSNVLGYAFTIKYFI